MLVFCKFLAHRAFLPIIDIKRRAMDVLQALMTLKINGVDTHKVSDTHWLRALLARGKTCVEASRRLGADKRAPQMASQ